LIFNAPVSYGIYMDMKAIITQINEKIGAAGVVSQECKSVVSQYGQQILDQLLVEVCHL
jgi:ribosomal protein S19E (S16A)